MIVFVAIFSFFLLPVLIPKLQNTSVSMFSNALRTHSRLRVLTATRIALPATRSITSLVAFRTAVPKNVSLSVSRSFTTSQVAREESQVAPKESEDSQVAPVELEDSQVAPEELENLQVASNGLEDSQVAPKELEDLQVASNELENSQVAPKELEDSQVAPKELEDGAPGALLDPPSSTLFVGNVPWKATEDELRQVFSQFGEIIDLRIRAYFFPLAVFFQLCFFLRTTSLDFYQHGGSSGTCHIDFASKDGAVATMASVAKKPLVVAGRKLRVEFSEGKTRKLVTEPNSKLYFSGCAGDELEIRTIFEQFRDSVVDVYLCMLFTLSNSVRTTHLE